MHALYRRLKGAPVPGDREQPAHRPFGSRDSCREAVGSSPGSTWEELASSSAGLGELQLPGDTIRDQWGRDRPSAERLSGAGGFLATRPCSQS